jgi:hypothetical protein
MGLRKIEAGSKPSGITDIRCRQKSENAGNNDDAELTCKNPIVKIRLNGSENAAEAKKRRSGSTGRQRLFYGGHGIWEPF